jgi:TolA-binding protein
VLGSGPTLEIAGLTLGLREGVIGLIGLLALYILFVVLRMRPLRLKAAAPPAPRPVPEPASALPVDLTDAADDSLPEPKRRSPPPEPPWDRAPVNMAESILRQGMEQELAQLREEVDSIRGELASLRADMQQEMALQRATQNVSPIYGDAMQMAMSGYDASLIAERCGIARAEAELVLALAKSQSK